jgi:hypothetical protein
MSLLLLFNQTVEYLIKNLPSEIWSEIGPTMMTSKNDSEDNSEENQIKFPAQALVMRIKGDLTVATPVNNYKANVVSRRVFSPARRNTIVRRIRGD